MLTKNKDGTVDILLKQGSTFEIVLLVKDKSVDPPVPLDLTGYTARGQIRKTPLSVDKVTDFTCTILDPPSSGQVKVFLSATVTASIPAGKTATDATSKYVYDIELADQTGRVTRVLQGRIFVDPEVTK